MEYAGFDQSHIKKMHFLTEALLVIKTTMTHLLAKNDQLFLSFLILLTVSRFLVFIVFGEHTYGTDRRKQVALFKD